MRSACGGCFRRIEGEGVYLHRHAGAYIIERVVVHHDCEPRPKGDSPWQPGRGRSYVTLGEGYGGCECVTSGD